MSDVNEATTNPINGLPIGSPTNPDGSAGGSTSTSQAASTPAVQYTTPTGVPINNGIPNSVNNYSEAFSPTNPQSTSDLAQSSIYSSAPPYTPVVDQPTTTNIQNQMYGQATNPTLAPGTQQTATLIDPNAAGNTLGYTNANVANGQVAQATAAPNVASVNNPGASTYNATMGTAAQGTVDPNSLVQNQMQDILNGPVDANGSPIWAQPAVTAARQQMAALGLGNSTMAANATTTAILQTALPMAEQNANTYAQINTQNLANQQATLLSNQAATNAAAQFNAQSETQNTQYFAGLNSNIALQNQSQANAMAQFNTSAKNSMSQFNASQDNAMAQFNANNQLLVNQSNVNWQRSVNTSNTAQINAVNNANAQNLFNMSQSALNNEWQQVQDQASWALTASENSQNRGLILATSAMNQQTSLSILNSQMSAQMFGQLGSFAATALGPSITSAASSLTSSSNNSGDFGGGGSLPNNDVAPGVISGQG